MRAIFFTLIILMSFLSNAQEMNFGVTVQPPRNTQVPEGLFVKLQYQIEALINKTQWTEVDFDPQERIEGNIQINVLKELGNDTYQAEMIIQASRPVYNSNYETTLISFVDKDVKFTYDGSNAISKTTDGYINNMSSIINFYVYYVLGLDTDSFKLNGGDEYYQIAQDIISNLPANIQQGDQGWSSQRNDQQNRFYMIENMRSKKMDEYRQAIYNYHRKGMDNMYTNHEQAREIILDAIRNIGNTHRQYTNSIVTRMFSDAKRNEIIDIFMISDDKVKNEVKAIMLNIDPAQSSLYKRLK